MERTILVAEDSPTQAEYMRLLLEEAGYRVELVTNGREGLERVRVAPPDLIISDIVMPEMDGYAFCEAVKSAEPLRRIPFVLLTGQQTPADVIRGFERGADNFIAKPFEDAHLLERIRRIFEHLDLRRQGHLDVEITLNVGGRHILINADRQQMVELLFTTLEELVRLNGRLAESQRTVQEYARGLEEKVRERTQQLLQTEKVASMGQLLAGVAHELNNPLAVVMAHARLLQQAPGSERSAQRADKIAGAAERCARIVKNFLALARQHPPERREVSLNRVAQEALELLAYPLRVDDVQVTLNLGGGLPTLWADPDQLHQVVVNLVTNAHHALRETPRPRRLTLTTRYDRGPDRVVLTVADTGPGIPPEVRRRVFEPFFTTKPTGQGTGLGLSLCQGVIESHGGAIGVESEPGRGTVFSVELPIGVPPSSLMTATADAATLPIGSRTILVVDDEPEVASLLAEMLSADGHAVDTAANGRIALERLRERTYDMILTDLRMPELDGPGFYRALEHHHARLARRVVFLTGDTLGPAVARFLDEVGLPSVSKPFDLDDVRRAIREVLLGA